MALNEKQKRFAQEYLKMRSVADAASGAGLEFSKTRKGFYIYILVNENDEVFYVGKGKGNRVECHDYEVRSGTVTNAAKSREILRLKSAGHEVSHHIIEDGLSSEAALSLEKGMMRAIGMKNLTNAQPGTTSQAEKDLLRVETMVASSLSFRSWMRIKKRTAIEIRAAKVYYRQLIALWLELHVQVNGRQV